MFKGNARLEEAVFPQLTAIFASNGYNFQGCISLSTAYMPKLIQASPREFDGCVNLKNTEFGSLSAVLHRKNCRAFLRKVMPDDLADFSIILDQ